MAQKTAFHNSNKPDLRKGFTWGLKLTNFKELFFVSGHAATDAEFNVHHPGDVVAQAQYIFDNVDSFLKEVGYSRDDIVRVDITTTKEVDEAEYPKMSQVMEEFFADVDVKPSAGTFRVVDRLFNREMLCEYEFLVAR